jgi:hypothetical protein
MAGGKKRGPKRRTPLPTEWRIVSRAPDGTTKREPLRAPTIFELVELRVAILCKHAHELGALLGESNFRTLMRLIDWQHHQLSTPQPLDQEFIDAVRWHAFRNGIKEQGRDNAEAYAVQALKGTLFAAGPDSMARAYKKMQRRLRPPRLRPRRRR